VADASAIAEFLAAGSGITPYDEALMTGDLHVPEVCDVEVFSAVRRSTLRGAVEADDARQLLLEYAELPLRRHRHLRLVGRAFELYENFAPGDAFYVALAERLEAPLLTADRRLARATRQRTGVEVLP
jgi:predicted nucleic acid-binding protein